MHGMDKRVAVENSPGDARAPLLSSTQYGQPLAGGAKQLACLPRPVKIKGSAAAHEMSYAAGGTHVDYCQHQDDAQEVYRGIK
jgi:hypothetical protein